VQRKGGTCSAPSLEVSDRAGEKNKKKNERVRDGKKEKERRGGDRRRGIVDGRELGEARSEVGESEGKWGMEREREQE